MKWGLIFLPFFSLQYSVAVLILVSNIFANSVNVAVVLSWGGQCMLLSCYIDGVKERLEEKSTELKAAMRVRILHTVILSITFT